MFLLYIMELSILENKIFDTADDFTVIAVVASPLGKVTVAEF